MRANRNAPLTETVLNKDANSIVFEIRRAASECQNVVAKLTERDETDLNRLVDFTTSISRMLVAVTRLRDQLLTTDQRIHKSQSRDVDIRRYTELNRAIANAEQTQNFSDEKRLRREYTLLIQVQGGKIIRFHADIRTSLVFRLEMVRYWQWFLRHAIDLYQFLTDSIIKNLLTLRNALPVDDELRMSIDSVVTTHSTCSTAIKSVDPEIPEDVRELKMKILAEITNLGETQSSLDMIREESKELENTEVLLKAEIEDQATSQSDLQDGPAATIDDFIGTPKQGDNHSRMVFRDRKR